ncbi:hypothetical protein [Pelomonas cellulosilytica]|uniref:Uncharacterized protein n=1 Tax=Pelomonas cellulosilytica TaxID=2906762 RepID=A0ABS8XS56_9BURK|nr:hypothetical protein [Pelomonas sp. P8]MCE4554527.1 hypothetical protein [Pelomonas sp. P8]
MESAKSPQMVALADELQGGGWRRPRRGIRALAIGSGLVAAGVVFVMFNKFGVIKGGTPKPEPQLIGTIDLRLGNPVAVAERGEAKARLDIEAGLAQLLVYGPVPAKADAARAARLKQRYGLVIVHKGQTPTPLLQAYADGYNRVMHAELERRHGREVADRLLREQGVELAAQEKKDAP